jgi:hypothetical protein
VDSRVAGLNFVQRLAIQDRVITTPMNIQPITQIVALAVVSLFAGCASTPSHWEDVTRNGRNQAEFTMDSGQCQQLSQDASYREQLSMNQENGNGCAGTPAGCATLGGPQGIDIALAGNNAFNACMNARGWILVAAQVPSKQAATPDAPAAAPSGAPAAANILYAGPKVTPSEAKENKPVRVLASGPAVFGVVTATIPVRTFGLEGVDGAMVTAVAPQSAGATAGIKVADILLRVNGKAVNGPDDVQAAIGAVDSGSIVEIRLMRKALPLWVSVQF